MNESELVDAIAAYALDALSKEDKIEVESYVAASPSAQQELETYRALLVGLAVAVPRHRASPTLLDQFRLRLAGNEASPANTQPATMTPMSGAKSATTAHDIPRRRSVWQIVAAIAATIIVIVGLASAYQSLTSDQRTIGEIENNAAASHIALAAQPGTPSGTSGNVRFVSVPGQTKAVLEAQLPALTTNQQYELWFIADNHPLRSVVFDGTPGAKMVLVTLPNTGTNYTLAITIEPHGGSDQPSSAPIFAGNFTLS